jgi:outer membrane protein, multidrug efflux system
MRSTRIIAALLVAQGVAAAQPRPSSRPGASPIAVTMSVDDPMLAPVPSPRRVVLSWRDAVAQLRAGSTDLRIAVDQMRAAEAQARVALAAYLPSISAGGSYLHELLTRTNPAAVQVVSGSRVVTSTTAPIANTFVGSVELKQTLLDLQALDQIGIDGLTADARRLSVEEKQRTLVVGLADQIVTVVTAERSAEINRVGLKVALTQLEIVKRSHDLGGATSLDVVRAEQNAADARAVLLVGDEFLREARESLGLALGVPEETGVSPAVNFNGLAEDAIGSCRPIHSVEERADVAAARMNLEVAKRNLKNVWFGFLPTLSARSTVSATSVVPTGYPNPTWSIEGLVTIPIWDGGARYGTIRAARAAEDVAAAELLSLHRRSIVQVTQAERRLVVAELSDKVARDQQSLAAKNDELTQAAFLAGQGTSLELVAASEAHRRAELNLALNDFGLVRARILSALALATCVP